MNHDQELISVKELVDSLQGIMVLIRQNAVNPDNSLFIHMLNIIELTYSAEQILREITRKIEEAP